MADHDDAPAFLRSPYGPGAVRYELVPDRQEYRSRRLPDTPPLGVLGYGVLGGIVALAMVGKALEAARSIPPALYLARHMRLRRIR